MDYQFTQFLGNVYLSCSMEHQAVANWFNSEQNLPQLALQLLQLIEQVKAKPNTEQQFIGHEYSLFIHIDEIMIRANNLTLNNEDELLETDFYFYEQESIAFCGLEDFEHFLHSYLNFIQ
ncbi:MAG: YacL family protein [Pasteurellaceae bacterium]|nr:YacL family protein [Pasteurellaceae bacterium]